MSGHSKNKLYLLFTTVFTLIILTACGSSEPAGVSIGDIEKTRVAQATEVVQQQEDAISQYITDLQSVAPEGTVVDENFTNRGHDNNVQYGFDPLPPSSGTHHGNWQRCDVYDAPIRSEHAIHALEHGAVWITYQPDLDEDSIETLEDIIDGERFGLMSPYPNLQSPIVLTAWGLQLELESADDARIQEFVDRFTNGPQNQEPGATCAQGVEFTVEQ